MAGRIPLIHLGLVAVVLASVVPALNLNVTQFLLGVCADHLQCGHSDAVASLYTQLRQGANQGCVDGSDFFVGDLLLEAGVGALTRFFGLGFVDVLGGNGHIREDGDVLARNFDEPFADGQELLASHL